MLRCGYCEKICDSYEEWLLHLVSTEHQSNIGISDTFENHNKDTDRNDRSLIIRKISSKAHPYDVVCHFANQEPLSFITDVYVHFFPQVNERFYMIVFDQKKFAQRIVSLCEKHGEQKVLTSLVNITSKSSLTDSEWSSKLEQSFFYRRHENIKRKLTEMNWDVQMENLLKFISLEQKGYELRESVMEELETLIREKYHEATVNPFGSCTTWLADVNADLDVYVDALGDGGRCDLQSDNKLEIMNVIVKVLKKKYDGKNVYAIRTARVPIIKLSHPSGLKVDISFENCLSVQNSKLIRHMTKVDYRVRRFLIFLRYWAKYHDLIGPHSVKSYALIMMAFVYLRKIKLLPSVYELQHIEGVNVYTVCNWNAAYCGSRELTYRHLPWLKGSRDAPSSEGIGHEVMKLAYGFFKEYSAVDFDSKVVCPLTGTFLPKESFDSQYGVDLPAEMALLKANLATSICRSFQTQKPLCVQDPFTLNVNITASCSSPEVVTQFKAACALSAEALKPFITTYGLAGTESFLELCCQPITEVKKMEAILNVTEACDSNNHDLVAHVKTEASDPNNHDHLAYVKTEATSSTHEDEQLWSTDNTIITNEITRIASQYRDDFQDTKFNFDREESSSYDGRRRDRDDSRPLRIQRINLYDDEREPDRARRSENYYSKTVIKNEEETMERKSLKSTVVVAGKNSSFKSEATSSSSPKRSSSFSSRESAKSSKGNEIQESTSTTTTTSLCDQKRNENGKSSSFTNNSKTTGDNNCNNFQYQKDQSFKEIVVVLENTSREVMDFKNASISSPAVSYNKPEKKTEPVVTFVRSPTSNTSQVQKPPSLLPLPPPAKETTKSMEQMVVYKEEEEEEDELDQVDKFLSSLQQIAPPDNVFFDTDIGNYGYEKAVQAKKQQHPKALVHYVPPKARNSGTIVQQPSTLPKRGQLSFPVFSLHVNDTYQQQFVNIFRDMTIVESVRDQKMRVLWFMSVCDFFLVAAFWTKFQPLYNNSTFQIKQVDETKVLFEMGRRRRATFLENDSHQYVYINTSRKRGIGTASDGMNDPQAKMFKQDPLIDTGYEYKAGLMVKLGKIPANVRKPFAHAYFFDCCFEHIEVLHSQWGKISHSLPLSPNRSPLDTFEKMCLEIAKAGQSNVSDDFLLQVKLLVAVDTNSDIPGIYFGFESSISREDPKWELQERLHVLLEDIFKDLIPNFNIHRLVKFFKK